MTPISQVHSSQTITWQEVLEEQKKLPYFQGIINHIEYDRSQGKIIYPASKDLYLALKLTPFESVKVVIIGQDPYHGPNQSHGLAFSVRPGIKIPPSLKNIFKELYNDLKKPTPEDGCLEHWAKQGVLLLNSVLTVQAHHPQSHSKIGWQQFTNTLISKLNYHPEPIVFCLWGSYAQQKEKLIDLTRHHVLKTTHPSPLSAHRGFLGCSHFSRANEILIQNNREPVEW